MLEFKETNSYIYVRTPYEMKMQVQLDLNGTWSKKENAYKFPKNLHCLHELLKLFPQLKLNTEFMELGKRLNTARQQALNLKQRTDALGDSRLRPYQRADVQYLKTLPHAAVFNDPRTGKSVTSLKVLVEEGRKKNCVVCPASLVLNWVKEVELWTDYPAFAAQGNLTKRKKVYEAYKNAEKGFLIISYDTLRSDIEIVEKM